jgi:hypothetical protein
MLSEYRYLTAGRLLTKSPPSSVVFVLLDTDVVYSSHSEVFLYNGGFIVDGITVLDPASTMAVWETNVLAH